MGKRKKLKKLQRQLDDLEAKKAQIRKYLLWAVFVVIPVIAMFFSNNYIPSGHY